MSVERSCAADCVFGMPATTAGDLHGKLHEEKLKYLVAELHFAHKEVPVCTVLYSYSLFLSYLYSLPLISVDCLHRILLKH